MKNSAARLAVAAAVVIVAALGVHYWMAPSITFADVVEPILNAHTMIFDVIIGDEETGAGMHEIISGQMIRRTMSNVPTMAMIIDLENSKMLVLDSADKTAAIVDMSGPVGDRHQNYVAAMRKIITALKDNNENLGEQEIDGRKAILFEAKGPNEQIKIWADPKTALPIRVELNLGQMFWILKNFQINPQIDESLVSMNVPDGYTAGKEELDMKDATEKDFIECLRVLAKIIGDGTFPDEIGTEQAMKLVTVLGQKMITSGLTEEQSCFCLCM